MGQIKAEKGGMGVREAGRARRTRRREMREEQPGSEWYGESGRAEDEEKRKFVEERVGEKTKVNIKE